MSIFSSPPKPEKPSPITPDTGVADAEAASEEERKRLLKLSQSQGSLSASRKSLLEDPATVTRRGLLGE